MKNHPISVTLAVAGISLAAASGAYGQANSGQAVFSNISITPLAGSTLGPMNGANLKIHAFNDAPTSVNTFNNSYPGSITFGESGVINSGGTGLERDVWYFSNNGGASAYNFQAGDYFTASFGLTLSGGLAGRDLEGGFLFSNPYGTWGGDDQVVAIGQGGNAGTVVQFGGPSYYPFSPAAGGYPGVGGSVPNYVNGTTIDMTFVYTLDPVTQKPAFEYAVNGQYAASAPGNDYFDLATPVGSPGDNLGGYFQLAPAPEPTTLALLGLGLLPLARRLRKRA
ncbi:MAG TPA: PEP-CTERM sorting domain-containing protein [Verrucomicrobiae bacterium]|nr:PEP-CTERM sorting domain-containing protein [Verrucomicrobiae bacterium]